MQSFKDNTGAQWELDLYCAEVDRVKKASGGKFDLIDPHAIIDGRKLCTTLMVDIIEFWELLAYLVGPQLDAAKVTAAEFGKRMRGECMVAAQMAFFREWQDFFRSLQREETAIALGVLIETRAQAVEEMLQRLQADPTLRELPTKTRAKFGQLLDSRFSDLRDSLAAILGPSLGERSTSGQPASGKSGGRKSSRKPRSSG